MSCDKRSESDWYGRFDVSWTGNNNLDSRRRLSNWLDPLNLNVTTLDGCTIHNLIDQVVAASVTITGCNINVQNMTFRNNVKLTLEAFNSIIINDNFEMQANSEFECIQSAINPFISGKTFLLKVVYGGDFLSSDLYKLQLNTDLKKFIIRAEANNIIGNYSLLGGNRIALQNFITTRIMPEEFDYEFYQLVIDALSEVDSFEVDDYGIYFMKDDEVVLEFEFESEGEENE